MAKISSQLKEEITKLSKKDLEKLVIKAATMHQPFQDYLVVNHIDTEYGEKELYHSAKTDLNKLMSKNYKGISEELKMANMLAACNKRINEFSKIAKDKSLEMDLILKMLEVAFFDQKLFGTCFTKFDHQVYLLVKKAITLLQTKLHEDYHIQYAPVINEYLKVLHKHSSHNDYVNGMVKEV